MVEVGIDKRGECSRHKECVLAAPFMAAVILIVGHAWRYSVVYHIYIPKINFEHSFFHLIPCGFSITNAFVQNTPITFINLGVIVTSVHHFARTRVNTELPTSSVRSVVVVIEVVERLSHLALDKVTVVRRGESYCTVLMPHTNTTH